MSYHDTAVIETASKLALHNEEEEKIDITEHTMSIEMVLEKYQTSYEAGLTDAGVLEARARNGGKYNKLTPPKKKHWLLLFFAHLTGFFSLLLWLAAFLCFLAYILKGDDISNLYLGIVLTTVTVMTGCFSYFQDAKSAAVMAGFASFLPESTLAKRNGAYQKYPSELIVPGDIVKVNAGDKIPADMMVLKASNFKVDNSSLTGESEPQTRKPENSETTPTEATNLAFYGTLVVSGNAEGIVIRTGDGSFIGQIAALASSTGNSKTPIAIEIEHFIHIVSSVAVFLGVTFLIIGFVIGTEWVLNLVFTIGIIVANVPEGLLATVTLSLSLTATRMAKKFVLVKNLEAVETLGSTTVIASDKTGTLTQNRMTVANLFYDGKIHSGQAKKFDAESASFQRLKSIATLCTNAKFVETEENRIKNPYPQTWACDGDASESAFIKFVQSIEDIEEVREANERIHEIPFSSATKMHVTISLQDNDWEKDRLLYLKGAPERVFDRCDYMLMDGEPVEMTDELKETYKSALNELMGGGERVLGFCYKLLETKDAEGNAQFEKGFVYHQEWEDEMNFPTEQGEGLIFAGLISLIDPPRLAVPKAVSKCQQAGIRVMMVTGDHPLTAAAIARKVGIIKGKTVGDVAKERGVDEKDVDPFDPEVEAIVITGKQLETMDADELDAVLDFEQIVFARTSPKQKLIIVEGCQNKEFVRRGQPLDKPLPVHHVVAVTGDGVNDSPALKAANIGVAMGIAGSDVAKEAADMILLDDNFASIVNGVEEGRLIFDNLKKSIAYTLSSNIPEISPFLVFILLQIPLPLPTVLILFIDLGTDMVPAISLAYELKEANIMQKPPRDARTDRLVTTKLVNFSYLQVGVIQALAGFYTYVVVLNDYGFPPNILLNLANDFFQANVRFPSDGSSPYIVRSDGGIAQMRECNIERVGICHNPEEALAHAQTAFFISIIVVQWADIIACKTRYLSLKQQGMRNHMLNFGLLFETTLGAMCLYITPLHAWFGTRDISFLHWLPALPFSMFIFFYDELRKYLMRSMGPDNWVKRNSYY